MAFVSIDGKETVQESDAFWYALKDCLFGESREEFLEEFDVNTSYYDLDEFQEELIGWFFSGNWTEVE